jgi:hypothetical protein
MDNAGAGGVLAYYRRKLNEEGNSIPEGLVDIECYEVRYAYRRWPGF